MNNGQQQQLHHRGLLNNDMLMNMVQQTQQEMSQQRGPQQQTFSVPFDRRIDTTATGGLPHVALLQSLQQQQQQAGNGATTSNSNTTTVLPLPLAGSNLSNRLIASGTPDDLLLQGAAAVSVSSLSHNNNNTKRKQLLEDDETSLVSMRTSATQDTTTVVDKEKVEAAFKSKPQPGKKRADLTEGERQELAKARNREHARQARMRKKARHEQLLHSEEMVLKMKQAEDLKNKRCQNLFRFLSIRGYMLMHSDDEASASQKIANSVACMSLLGEVVADLDKFQFQSNGMAVSPKSTDEKSSLSDMREWDKAFKRRLVKKFGPRCTDTLVNYKVINGKNGVALSADHTGFARVEIMIKVDGETKTVLSGILITHFKPDSPNFEGVSWATMREQ